jgi:hypothetical protein
VAAAATATAVPQGRLRPVEFRRLATEAGVRRRFAPHLRHAHARARPGTTSIYLQGIETEEIIAIVHARARR